VNILLTGGAGYVGSVCAEVLLQQGHHLAVVDSLVEGHRGALPENCTFFECDLLDGKKLDQAFESRQIDAVMHFAAEALVEKSMREPSIFYRTNVGGGIQLLDSMLRHGVKKIVFSSTAATYGEPKEVPIPEDHPKAPINPYGQTKWLFENILRDYGRYAGLKHVSLRYFNAAGASEDRGEAHRKETHLIPCILEAAAGERPRFDLYGKDYPTPDGTCVRDYVHVVDIAQAHVLALEALDRVSGEAFNVGNNRGYSNLEVLQAARRVTGKAIPSEFGPRRPGDPAVLVASSEKLRRVLGWKPQLSDLEKILESAWRWKQKNPHGYAETAGESARRGL
jgi:UDP-glucose 4-epimerase